MIAKLTQGIMRLYPVGARGWALDNSRTLEAVSSGGLPAVALCGSVARAVALDEVKDKPPKDIDFIARDWAGAQALIAHIVSAPEITRWVARTARDLRPFVPENAEAHIRVDIISALNLLPVCIFVLAPGRYAARVEVVGGVSGRFQVPTDLIESHKEFTARRGMPRDTRGAGVDDEPLSDDQPDDDRTVRRGTGMGDLGDVEIDWTYPKK